MRNKKEFVKYQINQKRERAKKLYLFTAFNIESNKFIEVNITCCILSSTPCFNIAHKAGVVLIISLTNSVFNRSSVFKINASRRFQLLLNKHLARYSPTNLIIPCCSQYSLHRIIDYFY